MNTQLTYELRRPKKLNRERNIQLFSYCMEWEVTNRICCLLLRGWKKNCLFLV